VSSPLAGGTALLLDSSPNPSRGSARVRFAATAAGPARLTVHDVRGALVEELLTGVVGAGLHELTWVGSGGSRLPAGTYFLRWETAAGVATRKLTILR
jgi:hypothetical protein